MSSTYSAALGVSPLVWNALECELSPSARSSLTAEQFFASIGLQCHATKMSERLPQNDSLPMGSQLTLFAVDSPARTSALPVRARASKANVAAYGQNTPVLLAKYDRASSSWKTSQLCLDGEWEGYSETWPKSGMTRNGTAYLLPTLERRTDENESGLWPTPLTVRAHDSDNTAGRYYPHKNQYDLAAAVNLWPTATVNGWRSEGSLLQLRRLVDIGLVAEAEAEAEAMAMGSLRPNRMDPWPTPTRGDYRSPNLNPAKNGQVEPASGHALPAAVGGLLNPTWVEWLMGFPAEWTALEDSEMPSSRKSRKSSAGRSLPHKRK